MRIVLGVTGSIAAYRSPDFAKALLDQGHEVQAVLTRTARELVSARVLGTVTGRPVLSEDPFAPDHSETDHISTARWADVFVIYAASANFLSRYAQGQADDFLSLQLLATRAPVVVAPAMNPTMWEHPAVQANLAVLKSRGVRFAGPISGKVACGETGVGHLAEHADIIAALAGVARSGHTHAPATVSGDTHAGTLAGTLAGKTVLISAGPMRTALDPVRYVQNRSSGRMGLEVARAARALGAHVQVLLGPVEQSMKREFEAFTTEHYIGPKEYSEKLDRLFGTCDLFFSLAAVLDFELESAHSKLERDVLSRSPELSLPLRTVPDFVARMASRKKPHQRVIAFAAESGSDEQILERAWAKLKKKGVDALVANPVREGLGPESERNLLWVLRPGAAQPLRLGPAAKRELAAPMLEALLQGV